MLGLILVMGRRASSKDVEILMLGHEVAVLCRTNRTPCLDWAARGSDTVLGTHRGRGSAPACGSVVEPETPDTPRVGPWPVGHPACVFLFFSSRLGCLGSLVLSVLLTLLLLWIFRVI